MSSLVMSAAPVNYEENNNNNNQKKPVERKNQTYKNKNSQKKIDKNMLQELYKSDNTDSDLDNMGDFIPVQKPIHNINVQQTNTHKPPMQYNDNPIDETTYNTLQDTQPNDMYQQYIDNYNQYTQPISTRTNLDSNSELLKKLDNILYLLEEQKEEQNHLITEELILYVFLGVFIIYVLDSFVRAGKYVR
jgi:hypothetical protein